MILEVIIGGAQGNGDIDLEQCLPHRVLLFHKVDVYVSYPLLSHYEGWLRWVIITNQEEAVVRLIEQGLDNQLDAWRLAHTTSRRRN